MRRYLFVKSEIEEVDEVKQLVDKQPNFVASIFPSQTAFF